MKKEIKIVRMNTGLQSYNIKSEILSNYNKYKYHSRIFTHTSAIKSVLLSLRTKKRKFLICSSIHYLDFGTALQENGVQLLPL